MLGAARTTGRWEAYMPDWFVVVQQNAAWLFASVLLIIVMFLIARVGKVSQPLALALALAPMAFVLALDKAIVPAFL
jgi:hypothetical protein